jgi:hypothetical protein
MKKKIACLAIAVVFLLGVISYPFLFTSFIEWQLRGYLARATDGHLLFEQIAVKDDQIVLEKPRVVVGTQTLVVAEEARIDYTVHLLSRRIEGEVTLIKPRLFLSQQKTMAVQYPLSKQKHRDALFQWDLTLTTVDGTLLLKEEEIPITLDHRNQRTALSLAFHHVDCSTIPFLENDLPSLLADRKIVGGFLDGVLCLSFHKGALTEMTGGLSVHQLMLQSVDGTPNPLGALEGSLSFFPEKLVAFTFNGTSDCQDQKCSFAIRGSRYAHGWDASLFLLRDKAHELPIFHVTSRTDNYAFDMPHLIPETFPIMKQSLHAFGVHLDGVEMLEGEMRGECQIAWCDPEHPASLKILSMNLSANEGKLRWNGLPAGWNTFSEMNGALDLLGHELHFVCNGFQGALIANQDEEKKDPILRCKMEKKDDMIVEMLFSRVKHRWNVEGSFSVADAEKEQPLCVTGIQAQLSLDQKAISLQEVQAFCLGLYFGGAIEINLAPEKGHQSEVKLSAHTVQGQIGQVKQLLSHFSPQCSLLKLPLEGEFALTKRGGECHIVHLQDGQYKVTADVHGAIHEGMMTTPWNGIALQEICCNVDYHYPKQTLTMSDIQGSFGSDEEYLFAGDYIQFDDIDANKLSFDLWVGNKARDIVRIVGQTLPHPSNEGLFEVVLDKSATHIGDIHPVISHCVVYDWKEIVSLNAAFPLRLDTIWHDLRPYLNGTWMPLPAQFTDALQGVQHASGELSVDIRYGKDVAHFQASGDKLQFDDLSFDGVVLSGKKQGQNWSIEQLQLGRLSFSADLEQHDEVWYIPFLGCRCGQGLLIGMKGQFYPDRQLFQGKLNLFEANLTTLRDEPLLRDFCQQYQVQGMLRATGSVEVQCDKWRVDARLQTAIRSLEIQGLSFVDADRIQTHFSSDEGLLMKGLTASLKKNRSSTSSLPIQVAEIHYQPKKQQLFLTGDCSIKEQKIAFRAQMPTSFQKGEILLSESSLPDAPTLLVQWRSNESGGAVFDRMVGDLLGWHFDLGALTEAEKGSLQGAISYGHFANGEIALDRLIVTSNSQGEPLFFIPHLKVKQMTLGSLHPFAIKDGEIFECKGKLSALEEFSSKGYIQFDQPIEISKERLEKTKAEAEIAFLIPSSGTIYFDVHDEKIFLTRLEHVHSENKLSKFMLPKGKSPSYIGFNGDLHLQLQVKPYHMISKLADLFTLSIEGSVGDPVCRFQRRE